jgi:predicted AlkP superfamily pyrophosphatase or phosphodiesterase
MMGEAAAAVEGFIISLMRFARSNSGSSAFKVDLPSPRFSRWRALTLAVAILALAALGLLFATDRPGSTTARHVLVISIDGMGSAYYTHPPAAAQIPNLRCLMERGSFAEAVEGVYPTLTYPSHTTLVTGRMPVEHGIYTNLSSRQAGKNPEDWFWFANAIKAPTLWDEARMHHLTTASVAWPVTVGAPIDWDVPEIWDPAKGEVPDAMYVVRHMNLGTAVEVAMALGLPSRGSEDDENRVRLASYFLVKHRPNLTLVHLEGLDAVQHAAGPDCAPAFATLTREDFHVGELLAAVEKAGLESSTDVFVVSDHGFLPIVRDIQPNVLLTKAGLLTADSAGNVTGGRIATVSNGGSFFIYWPEDADFSAEVKAALKPITDQELAYAVLDQQSLQRMGADPKARLALDAPDGAEFTDSAAGALVKPFTPPAGTHGFLPSRPGLQSAFIACGPDIQPGVDVGRIQMTEIGPTILKAMGIKDPTFGDRPPIEAVFKSQHDVLASHPATAHPYGR